MLLTSERKGSFEINFSALTLMEDLGKKRVEELYENEACSRATARTWWDPGL